MKKPQIEKAHQSGMGGIQRIYKFKNGYGASVIQCPFSYGGEVGLWELAVIKFKSESMDEWSITYDTPITNDVEGNLTESDVDELLYRISYLNEK
jgi:hypothetical protein